MYHLDNESGVSTYALAPVKSTQRLWFTEGGHGNTISYPGADWFNMVQAELLSVLDDAGITPDKGQLNQIAQAIRQMSEGKARAYIEQLGKADGFRFVGQAESIEQLRTIRPTEHGQRILVKSYYAGGTTGGGEFIADLQDLITPDDGGTCVVVTNNGGRWKRLYTSLSDNDFGLFGDGRDETAGLQAALQAAVGKSLKLSRGRKYGIQTITIPQDTNLKANYAEIRKLSASQDYGITIYGNSQISNLRFSSPGSSVDRAIRISGSRLDIKGLSVSSDRPGSDYGLHIQSLALDTPLTELHLQNVTIKNYDAAMPIFSVNQSFFNNIKVDTYRTGIYLRDVADCVFNFAHISTKSPNAQGAPGQNGLLIESTLNAYSCRNLHFIHWRVSDAAEHGYRLGGQLGIRDVTFTDCISERSGNHGGRSSGGCGFKVLGATSRVSRHKNIKFIGCHVQDVNVKSGLDNISGYLLALVDGVVLDGCSVGKVVNTDYACIDGIQIDGATDVVLNGNNVQDANRQSIRCVASTYAGQPGQDGIIDGLNVIGGLYQAKHKNNAPIVFFDVNTSAVSAGAISNVSFKGVTLRGGMAAVRSNDRITYNNIFMDFDYDNGLNSGATPVIPGKGDIFYRANLPWIGYTPTAKNGSIIIDTLTGAVRLRKNDSWVII